MESRVYKSIRKSVIEPVQIDKKHFFPVSCNNNQSDSDKKQIVIRDFGTYS